jgi:hypothetical protein
LAIHNAKIVARHISARPVGFLLANPERFKTVQQFFDDLSTRPGASGWLLIARRAVPRANCARSPAALWHDTGPDDGGWIEQSGPDSRFAWLSWRSAATTGRC